jgi:hypothetical protein
VSLASLPTIELLRSKHKDIVVAFLLQGLGQAITDLLAVSVSQPELLFKQE